jgi:hypothetical protein
MLINVKLDGRKVYAKIRIWPCLNRITRPNRITLAVKQPNKFFKKYIMMSFTKRIVANIKKDFYNLIRKHNVLNKIISKYILNLLRKLIKYYT